MMRNLIALMLALTLLAVPTAFAEREPSEPSEPAEGENAWVEDCPPDHMCAYEAPADDEPTHDGRIGDDDCIDCMQGPTRGPEDCEFCRGADGEQHDPETDYVQAPEGSEVGITSVEDDQATGRNTVPAPAIALVVLGLLGSVLLLGRRS